MFTYLVGKEEGLQKRIHITGGSLIFKSNKTSVFLRIPADTMRSLGINVHFQCDLIVFAETTFGIQHLIPIHKVTESPVILFAKKQMLDLPVKVFNTFLLSQKPQVSYSIARPRWWLWISITLQKEPQELLGSSVLLGWCVSRHNLWGQREDRAKTGHMNL